MVEVYANPIQSAYGISLQKQYDFEDTYIRPVQYEPIFHTYVNRLKFSRMSEYEINDNAFTYALIQALYKKKLINTATFNKIMTRFDGGGLAYAKKRDHFNDMIRDAKEDKFDLIVTREVCRLSRNTVDTLEYTRMLRKHGVEVYFVEDNIYTFSNDGELRLTIMAALAQEESRKVSERVLAGQQVSREKGVIYGCGNILGYKLVRKFDENGKWSSTDNKYVIDEEQAAIVRKIYEYYLDGMSTTMDIDIR